MAQCTLETDCTTKRLNYLFAVGQSQTPAGMVTDDGIIRAEKWRK